jgi:hypothetical protein
MQPNGPESSGPPTLVVGVFQDGVRAEQAVRALEVWRSANRGLGVGPIGVVALGTSGTTSWQIRGVTRPRRAAWRGALIGLVLFALPAAGAAGLAAWLVGSIVFGIAGLVGIVPANDVGGLVVALMLGGAMLAGIFAGLAGAVLGCLIGLVVGLIDREVRGLNRADIATTARALQPGGWATVARAQPMIEPLLRDELARLGASPVLERDVRPLPAATST